MEKDDVIGIYKFLSKGEEIIFESSTITHVLQVKEAHIKKVLNREERRDIPLSFDDTKLYLTTKRLIFLSLYQKYSRDFGGGDERFGGVEGNWTEIPVDAIIDYEVRPLIINESKWKGFEDQIGEIYAKHERGASSVLEIVFDEKRASGRSLEYAEGLMKRGRIAKRLGKVKRISDKLLILGNDAVSIAPSLKQFKLAKKKTKTTTEEDFFCNKCGTKQQESDARFCSKCGTPLQPTIESTQ